MECGREKGFAGRCPLPQLSDVTRSVMRSLCCRQDAAVACITPHKRTPPQFGHPESRNDSYRLTPKPRITWHTGRPAARQPSILRIYYYSPIGTGGLLRLKDGRAGQKFSTRTPRCANQQPLLVSRSVVSRESRPADWDGTVWSSPDLP